VATISNLGNTKIPTKNIDQNTQSKYQSILTDINPHDLQEVYDVYVKRVNNRDYGHINWSLYLEDQFPLYNCMKVNPSDRRNNSLRSVYQAIQQSITNRDDWAQTKKEIEENYGMQVSDIESIKEAIILHQKTDRKTRVVNKQQYELLEFKEIDYDSRAHLELRYLYSLIREWFHSTGVLHMKDSNDEGKTLQEILYGKRGPKRVLIWASRDRSRLRQLRKESYQIWKSLNIPSDFFKYTYINVLHYLPVGEQTEWGFMLESLDYKSGFRKFINPGNSIDPYDFSDLYQVVLDLSSTESTAQELLSRGLADSREVGYANRTIPMGYSVTNLVGVLTS
jgi:hypothetical protein